MKKTLAIFLISVMLFSAGNVFASTMFENYDSGTDDYGSVGDNTIRTGQTFTPATTHVLDYVVLALSKQGGATAGTIEIFNTSAGVPTGTALVSQSFSETGISSFPGWTYLTINLTSHPELEAGTMYAIVLSDTGTYPALSWAFKHANEYTGGTYVESTDVGTWATWTAYSTYDRWFQEWGTSTETPPATGTEMYQQIIATGTGNFWINQSLSYGDILILVFLILFFCIEVFRVIWNFVWKDPKAKL